LSQPLFESFATEIGQRPGSGKNMVILHEFFNSVYSNTGFENLCSCCCDTTSESWSR